MVHKVMSSQSPQTYPEVCSTNLLSSIQADEVNTIKLHLRSVDLEGHLGKNWSSESQLSQEQTRESAGLSS